MGCTARMVQPTRSRHAVHGIGRRAPQGFRENILKMKKDLIGYLIYRSDMLDTARIHKICIPCKVCHVID
jgi:hypothetical protein